MLDALGDIPSGCIVELGPGTGAITEVLLERFPVDRIIAVERDRQLADKLKQRWPELTVINGSAQQLATLLPADSRINGVVSSLPLLNMPPAVRLEILRASIALMPAEAIRYVQFSYGIHSPTTNARTYCDGFASTMHAAHLAQYATSGPCGVLSAAGAQ